MRANTANHTLPHPESARGPGQTFNPRTDPFVETGYRGYIIRGIARYQPGRLYSAALEISMFWQSTKLVLCEHEFEGQFMDASEALKHSIHAGRQAIDEHVEYSISVLEVEFNQNEKPETCVQMSYSPRVRYRQQFWGQKH
jgi:hypothetical protein